MERDFDLYESADGKSYAVLVSTRFGIEWSNGDPRIACDKRIVEFWLAHKDDEEFLDNITDGSFARVRNSSAYKECKEFFKSLGFERPPYSMGGFAGIELVWVDYGEMWRINSYDGAEEIEFFYPGSYNCFEKGEKTC